MNVSVNELTVIGDILRKGRKRNTSIIMNCTLFFIIKTVRL